MPGSLMLENDLYSEYSGASVRSLDSKLGGKKVSFNKAVRVKQYPWKQDFEPNKPEHLTLPSDRFWFKVHKNKQEPPVNVIQRIPPKRNAWTEEFIDPLTPIAEDEDQEMEYHDSEFHNGKNCYDSIVEQSDSYLNSNKNTHYRREPPVDYTSDFNPIRTSFNTGDSYYKTNDNKKETFNGANRISGTSLWESNINRKLNNAERDSDSTRDRYNGTGLHSYSEMLNGSHKTMDSDSPFRRSVRNFDDLESTRARERRSRSHDDYMDESSRFKLLKKADKSVSTEDVNLSPTNRSFIDRFLKNSRDIATQCNGTLSRNNGVAAIANKLASTKSDEERLNNFKTQSPSRMSFNRERPRLQTSKTTALLSDNSRDIHSVRSVPLAKPNGLPPTGRNSIYRRNDVKVNGNVSSGTDKVTNRTMKDPLIPRINRNGTKELIPRVELRLDKSPDRQQRIQNGQSKASRDSTTVGYLRGQQIPLSEVNTNTNRRLLNRSEPDFNRNLPFRKTIENPSSNGRAVSSVVQNPSRSPIRRYMTSNQENSAILKNPSRSPVRRYLTSDQENNVMQNPNRSPIRRYLTPNQENTSDRLRSNGIQSAKSHSDADTSMIDWSLSGFHLSPRYDSGVTSMSDSEYTVHKRPQLLMYIPGVSHHDRPAIEDDRLSALSDLSRSNDRLSSIGGTGSSIGDRSSPGGLRRHHSMPRNGKPKWLKWKNKS